MKPRAVAPRVEPPIETQAGGPAAPPVAGAAINVRGLAHSFGDLRVLEGVELSVPAGGVLGVVGPSGCGKSTLLELVGGLQEPSEGTAAVGVASSPGERLVRCALMAQRDLLLPWASAIDNAALAPSLAGCSRSEARERARPLFERFGLGGFELARPAELSGGMRQRVAFLRTLMAHKPVLLLDEPFASLDAITRAEMQTWLAGILRSDAHTVVLVTHDVEEALYLCDRVAVMTRRPGRVAVEIEVPGPRATDRAAAVTSTAFGELRERALRALAEGGGRGR
jgi:NitT/TauT family transport system ATP-binding protein